MSDKRFNNYHRIIGELVGEFSEKKLKLDKQVVIIYELRSFYKYYPVSRRILNDLKENWAENKRLIEEIDLTLKYIDESVIKKILISINKKY